MKSNFDELRKIHADLDCQLGKEVQRPNPDHIIMTKIKREKLKVKDAIATMVSS